LTVTGKLPRWRDPAGARRTGMPGCRDAGVLSPGAGIVLIQVPELGDPELDRPGILQDLIPGKM
jgi:hypothetical protein